MTRFRKFDFRKNDLPKPSISTHLGYTSFLRVLQGISMKIASWNVNSLKVRLPHVLAWLEEHSPDVLALQELKLTDDSFPKDDIEAAGYQVCFSGQKTYNGVAILSKTPIKAVQKQMPDYLDEQQRVIAATIGDVRVVNVYVPNGQSVDSDKYFYKLSWLEALKKYLADTLSHYQHVVLLGDFNIAPDDRDVHDPTAWEGHVLVSQAEREAFQAILNLGFVDSFRLFEQENDQYSWWDYRKFAFRRNLGLRIDMILMSNALKTHCSYANIDVAPRRLERPSDHTPVICRLNFP
jgi:exodeoxyribonuclease III